ncbi:MAG: hypothetical protein DWQ07_14380 [Chloroflexi bacterium]|nr:MAG: hypothetical protein DWQ07_14380 [Chloroflexota bacterium]MBL1195730.1 hypothetical protein [Chloroflexota bacterium]NOH13018.1 hypothetical protein [Chloroflexota bacterium]
MNNNDERINDQNNDQRIKFMKVLRNVNIQWLVLLPILIALGLSSFWGSIRQSLFGNNVPEAADSFAWGFMAIVSSLAGFAQIWRREAPGAMLRPIRGPFAVLTGILFVLVTWGAGLYLIISALISLYATVSP